MRTDRLKEIIQKIEAEPSTYDQTAWHTPCRTAHCIAGHCQIAMFNADTQEKVWRLINEYGSYEKPLQDGQDWLELTHDEAYYLFAGDRTLDEIKKFYCAAVRKEQEALETA